MTRSSLIAFVLLAGIGRADELEELIKKDRQRIANKGPLDKSKCAAATDLKTVQRKPIASYELLVIPVFFSDVELAKEDSAEQDLKDYVTRMSFRSCELKTTRLTPIRQSNTRAEVARHRLGSTREGEVLENIFKAAELEKRLGSFDGVCVLYAGAMEQDRQSMLWPHKGTLKVGAATVAYFIAPQKAGSVHAHEFMHLLGLDDKREGSSKHCILSYGYEPLPLCGSCAAQIGWVKCHVTGLGREAWLALPDVTESGSVLRVNLNPDGKEFLLLEARAKTLIVWRTLDGKTEFVAEIDGVSADRLTPLSLPRFKPAKPGSRDVYLTDIRFDGTTAYFKVSMHEPLTNVERYNLSKIGKVITPKK